MRRVANKNKLKKADKLEVSENETAKDENGTKEEETKVETEA
jgi:hypothetical protein